MLDTVVAYDVRMRTPIGIRIGRITVTENQGKIHGFFDILNHCEPFSGTIDQNRNCDVTGKIITLMRTIHYHAVGKILPEEISLSIQDGYHTLEITGKPADCTKEP